MLCRVGFLCQINCINVALLFGNSLFSALHNVSVATQTHSTGQSAMSRSAMLSLFIERALFLSFPRERLLVYLVQCLFHVSYVEWLFSHTLNCLFHVMFERTEIAIVFPYCSARPNCVVHSCCSHNVQYHCVRPSQRISLYVSVHFLPSKRTTHLIKFY